MFCFLRRLVSGKGAFAVNKKSSLNLVEDECRVCIFIVAGLQLEKYKGVFKELCRHRILSCVLVHSILAGKIAHKWNTCHVQSA